MTADTECGCTESGLEGLGRRLYENMPATVVILAAACVAGAIAWGSPSCS